MDDKNSKVFREKSVQAINSPETMNDYLRVTSPGIWLLPAGVIIIMIGVLVWSILGSVETYAQVTVQAKVNEIVCYVPEKALNAVLKGESVRVGGEMLNLRTEAIKPLTVTEDMDVFVRTNGELKNGDVIYTIPAEGTLETGSYCGTIITEKLKPISLLLN